VTKTARAEPGAGPGERAPELARSERWATWLPDYLVCLAFVLLAAWLTKGLWSDPAHRILALNQRDQVLYEWLLANDARVLFGDLGLLSDRLNAPDGVNLLANTSVIVLGVLLAPVTLGFGSATTFALLAAGNLALTAAAWYFLYSRTLGARRTAAALGAGLCGFAPAMVSQSNGHVHMTAQWLVPVMVWLVVRLLRAADPERPAAATDAAGTDGAATDATGTDRHPRRNVHRSLRARRDRVDGQVSAADVRAAGRGGQDRHDAEHRCRPSPAGAGGRGGLGRVLRGPRP
jgi:hypothetical protein